MPDNRPAAGCSGRGCAGPARQLHLYITAPRKSNRALLIPAGAGGRWPVVSGQWPVVSCRRSGTEGDVSGRVATRNLGPLTAIFGLHAGLSLLGCVRSDFAQLSGCVTTSMWCRLKPTGPGSLGTGNLPTDSGMQYTLETALVVATAKRISGLRSRFEASLR